MAVAVLSFLGALGVAWVTYAIKGARALGRIEQGVAGVYPRLERIERWIDDIDHGRN